MPPLPALAQTALPAAMVQAERDSARSYVLAEKAVSTRRAYRSDWAIFTAWCAARDLVPIPATADTVATFLASQANTGTKPATLSRRAAAIRYAHLAAELEAPTKSERVRATLRGIRRTSGAAQIRKAPATAKLVAKMAKMVPGTLTGLRDRALLLIGFAGAFRRSELVALRVEDLEHTPDGIRVTIRRSKTDQEGSGQIIAIPAGGKLQAVEALTAWLTAGEITAGPLFRAVNKSGRVLPDALTDRSVANIVKVHAGRADLDAAVFSGHSLRAGFLTSAAAHGANIFKMAAQSRHKSLNVLRGYVRDAELFKDHAGARFL